MAASPTVGRDSQRLPNSKKLSQEQQPLQPSDSSTHDNTSLTANLPGKLSMLGKVFFVAVFLFVLPFVRTLVLALKYPFMVFIRKLYNKGKMHRKLLFKHFGMHQLQKILSGL